MYLIKLVTQRYSFGNDSEKIIGYFETEEKAKEFCDVETLKLDYNRNMGSMCYTYEKIERLG